MTDILTLKKFEALGPFEIKNELIDLAKKTSKTTQSAFLNAGRGNPNWVATTPREGFFLLGQFAITESKRVMELSPGIGGMPEAKGSAARLNAWLAKHDDMPGADFLSAMVSFAVKTFKFEPDAFVHELVDSIIGDNYPVPDRMLVHNERIVHEYLLWAMCGKPHPSGKFDIYAVEGGTAAMCYIFKSLKANRLLFPGDTIALGTPIFTPYIEMTHLEDYALKVVNIAAPQENRFQYSDAELKKLEDPKIKAFFVVNPGNPSGMGMSRETIAKLVNLVKTKRPDLMLLTDDVYGTFVNDFRSLLGELPYNTIGVYSYSKYFGCTGWRLGTIAVHEKNIFVDIIAKKPAEHV
jgi:aspartate 4-decarboxylase